MFFHKAEVTLLEYDILAFHLNSKRSLFNALICEVAYPFLQINSHRRAFPIFDLVIHPDPPNSQGKFFLIFQVQGQSLNLSFLQPKIRLQSRNLHFAFSPPALAVAPTTCHYSCLSLRLSRCFCLRTSAMTAKSYILGCCEYCRVPHWLDHYSSRVWSLRNYPKSFSDAWCLREWLITLTHSAVWAFPVSFDPEWLWGSSCSQIKKLSVIFHYKSGWTFHNCWPLES